MAQRFDPLLVDRYLTAFENGAPDEATCGHRVLRPTLRRDAGVPELAGGELLRVLRTSTRYPVIVVTAPGVS